MESERRGRHERIKDSNVAAENAGASGAELPAGSSEYSGQTVWVLHRTTDDGVDRIPGLPLHAGQPGECDPSFHLLGGMHWDSGSIQDRKHSAQKDQ